MRTNPSEGFRTEEAAQNVLDVLKQLAGDKLLKAEIEPTLFSHPDNVWYQIRVIYHDKDKTPFQVRTEVKTSSDILQLTEEGCVHEYSLGTVHDYQTAGHWIRAECHACHGAVDVTEANILRYILGTSDGKLEYDRWPQAEQNNG